VFIWKLDPPTGRKVAGKRAGHVNQEGYEIIGFSGRHVYLSHRLAFLWMTGAWPANEVDHINGVPSDNRFSNLRQATRSENARNRRTNCNSASKLKGAFWHPQMRRYFSRIMKDGVYRYLGLFETKEEAHAAYCKAAKELHGEFARVIP
jgi:hypothetical protein